MITVAAVGQLDHQGKVLVGNYFVFAPNGVSWVIDDKAAFAIDPGGEYNAGPAAPNGSYHASTFTIKTTKIHFEWSRMGDAVAARFSADQAIEIPIKINEPWPNWHSHFSRQGHAWMGTAIAIEGTTWSTQSDPELVGSDPQALSITITPDKPARLVAGLGSLPSLHSVDRILARAKSAYEKSTPTASGDWGDFLGAISNNLENSRIYSNNDHRLAISVSRRWAGGPNEDPYFCWDSFFNGALSSLVDPVIARDTVRAILSCQSSEGMVPNYGHWNIPAGPVSEDRSQPPVGALCVWKIEQRWPSHDFLAEVYPKLLKWHRWWPTARDGKHDGLLEWGSTVSKPGAAGKQGAQWETGWDDTVEYSDAEMEGSTLNAYAVDLNPLWAMDADYLARIADRLGKKKDASELRIEADRTRQLINEKLWNPDLGIYCSRRWDGKFLTRLTPMNFYPLIAGAGTGDRAEQVLKTVTDPKLFWGDYVLPTVSYTDAVWPQQDYWRGKVWGPTNYLVWQGLQQVADSETRQTFAEKSVSLFMRNWNESGVCGENYLSSTGKQSSDPHYTWGSLLCLIGVERACQILPDGTVVLDGTQKANLRLDRLPIAGKLYTIICSPGRVELLRGSRRVGLAIGKVIQLKL